MPHVTHSQARDIAKRVAKQELDWRTIGAPKRIALSPAQTAAILPVIEAAVLSGLASAGCLGRASAASDRLVDRLAASHDRASRH